MQFMGKTWHQNDVAALCSLVTGVCGTLAALILTTVASIQSNIHPHDPVVIPVGWIVASGVIGAIGTLAQQVIRVISLPSAPANYSYVVTDQKTPTVKSLTPITDPTKANT